MSDHFDAVRPPSAQGGDEPTVIEQYLGKPLAEIPQKDWIDIYEAVKGALPPHKLQDIDLAEELVLQFMRVKDLQIATLSDTSTPANQKAQVANAVSGVLTQLTKLQTELHTAERVKLLENQLILALKEFPELSDRFLGEYERVLGGL